MEETLKEVLTEAIAKMREGDFQESVNAYMKAIDLSPRNPNIYMAMSKSAYLLGAPILAVHSHLCAAHLELHTLYNQLEEGQAPEGYLEFYEGLPADLKDSLPHKAAGIIVGDFNLAKDLGHAVIDLDPKRPDELAGVVEIYRKQIQGHEVHDVLYEAHSVTEEEMNNLDRQRYAPTGFNFLMNHIEWDELHNPKVFTLYFDEEKIKEKYGVEEEEEKEEDIK